MRTMGGYEEIGPQKCVAERLGRFGQKIFYCVYALAAVQRTMRSRPSKDEKDFYLLVSLCILIYTSSYCVRRTSSRRASPTSSVSKTPHIKFWVKFIE